MDNYSKPKTTANNNTTTPNQNTRQNRDEINKQATGTVRTVVERKTDTPSYDVKKTVGKNETIISQVKKEFDNTHIASFTKSVGADAINIAERKFSSQGDFASDNVTGLIKTAKFSTGTFKAAQITTDVGIKAGVQTAKTTVKATVNVGKGAYEVGNQTVKTAVTAVQAFSIIKGANINPVSKEALRTIKACAIGTGLANTKISQRLVGIVNNTKSAINDAGNKVKTTVNATVRTTVNVGKGVYAVGNQTVKTAVTAVQAFNIIKGANINPISKEALSTIKACAIGTGLANTKISQRLVGIVNNTKTALVDAGNKVRTTVNTGVKTVVGGWHAVQREARLFTFFIANKNYKFAMYQAEVLAKNLGIKTMIGGIKLAKGGARVATPVVKGAIKVMPKVARVGVKTAKVGIKGANIAKSGVVGISSVFASGDDYALQGVATAIRAADVATKAVGVGARTSYTVGKGLGKVGIKTAKGSVKAVKGISAWANLVKTNGWKKAMAEAGKRAGRGALALLKSGGSSVVSAVMNIVSSLGKKYIVPLLLIIVAINGSLSILSAPIMAVASTISGIFGGRDDSTDVEEEFVVDEFMMNTTYGIPVYSIQTKNELQTNITRDGSNYHIVRLRQLGEVIATDANSIASSFYSDEEIAQMLTPIFNAVVYHKYDGSPKMSQAKNLLKDMYNDVFNISSTTSTEYCGQDLSTGSGTPNTACLCGVIHAILDPNDGDLCPNCTYGTHTTYTCNECCDYAYKCEGHGTAVAVCGITAHTHSWQCCDIPTHASCTHQYCDAYWPKDSNGNYIGSVCDRYHDHNISGCNRNNCGNQTEHSHSSWFDKNNEGCYSTTYCSSDFYVNGVGLRNNVCGNWSSYFYCNGYAVCGGHSVKTYSLDLEGVEKLVKKHFTDRINSLERQANRNDAEQDELNTLKDYYEIYLVTMEEFAQSGRLGTISFEELDNVVWDNSSGGNRDVVNLALSQVGNAGGSKYWSWYGFSQRNEWSGCFVEWCMRNTPSTRSTYPYSADNSNANTLAVHLNDMGHFRSAYSSWTIVRAGDLIFFDAQGDGRMDRVGIIIGTSGNGAYVYTVEGNSADAVRIKMYQTSNTQIGGKAWVNR